MAGLFGPDYNIPEEVGRIWAIEKDITFAQVYVATTIAEDTIMKVHQHNNQEVIIRSSKIVLGNIEDDYHSLGRRLVETSLKATGWDIIDLGVDIPAEEFVDVAVRENAKIIMISSMLYSTAMNIKKVRELINQRGYKDQIKLVVGGAIFNVKEDLWKEVGADYVGRSALDAGKLAQEILDLSSSDE